MPQVSGYTPIDVSKFGGLVTIVDATSLPVYLSPDTKNVEFLPGLVRTRPGITSVFSTLTGVPNVNYLKTYINSLVQARLLILDSEGNIYKEAPQGTLTKIGTIEVPGDYCNSVSLFAKEYMALGDNLFGNDYALQYNDASLERVSQVGPGAGPSAASFIPPAVTIENTVSPVTVPIASSPTGIVFSNINTVISGIIYSADLTFTTSTPHGLVPGNTFTVSGSTSTPSVNTMWSAGFGNLPGPNTVFLPDVFFMVASPASFINGGGGMIQNSATGGVDYIRMANNATVTTLIAHGFQPGWTVSITGMGTQAVGGGITDINNLTGIATVTTATPHGFVPGAIAIITGTSNYNSPTGGDTVLTVPSPTMFTYSYSGSGGDETSGTVSTPIDGTYTVLTTPTATTFTYFQLGPNITSTTIGLATIIGNISGGLHQVAVSFIYDTGYITQPSPPVNFYAVGNQLVGLSNIPTGPSPGVVQRLVMFTPLLAPDATLGSFYSIEPQMFILDNTTTSAIFDFTDGNLIAGVLQDPLFDLELLPEAAGVTEYNSRLFWWGLRDNLDNFQNLTFQGGFGGPGGGFAGTYPLGWTLDPTSGAGGGQDTSIFGDVWFIEGDGATAIRGMITQGAYQNWDTSTRFAENTDYSVRLRLSKDTSQISGNIVCDVFVPSTSSVLGSFTVPNASMSQQVTEFTGDLLSPQTTIPADTVVRVYADGTPTILESYYVHDVEFFETSSPYLTTDAWGSQVNLPENYSASIDSSGLISVAPENGQPIRNMFRLRNYLYIVKVSSLYVTAADGQNEPSGWDVNEVSSQVGSPSPRGVGLGDEWAAIAGQAGLYLFTGSALTDQDKLSNEIQPTWNTINWSAGQTIITKVDITRKRIYVAVPVGTATIPNKLFVLDYVEGFGDPLGGGGTGRKWTIWDITTNAMDFILRNDGTEPLFLGNNVGNGKIYQLGTSVETSHNDDGVAIDGYWQPGFFQQDTRLNFGYLTANITGSGTCLLTLRKGNQQWLEAVRPWTLNTTNFGNFERQIQQDAERCSIKFETNGLTDWFSLQGASMFVQDSAYAKVRGKNT